ncbi:MAG: FMN-binding protein [Ruminococcus sp.]|nr:FMN-binding protein [Ruminococcus sp.]
MKKWKKWKPICGFLPVVLVAACVGKSLSGYQAPVLTMGVVPEQTYSDSESEEAIATGTTAQTTTTATARTARTTAIAISTVQAEAAVLQVEVVSDDAVYADGVYIGTGTGFRGTITVQVTISGGKITDLTVLSTSDDASYFSVATALLDQIIATQSTNVDTVSGATYSSVGLIEAVRNALQQVAVDGTAAESVADVSVSDASGQNTSGGSTAALSKKQTAKQTDADDTYRDGTYTGTGTGFHGEITVEVVVKNGAISDITILESSDDAEYLAVAFALLDQIIAQQRTDVDTVYGATYSSVGLIEAVCDALSGAVVHEENTAKTTTATSNHSRAATTTTKARTTTAVQSTVTVPQNTQKRGAFPYQDGTYTGTGDGFCGEITLAVTAKNGYLTAITVQQSDDDAAYFEKAFALISTILETQSLAVDAVSGATYSSEGILDAVSDALSHAEEYVTTTAKTTQTIAAKTVTASSKQTQSTETVTTAVTMESDSEARYQDGTYQGITICEPDDSEDFASY